MLDVVLSSPRMYMHGFALVYIYIYMNPSGFFPNSFLMVNTFL